MKIEKLYTRIFILCGLLCYLVLLGSAQLLHNHSHHQHDQYDCHHEQESESTPHAEEDCAACAFINTYIAFQFQLSHLSVKKLYLETLPLTEVSFINFSPTVNLQSRAPPILSN